MLFASATHSDPTRVLVALAVVAGLVFILYVASQRRKAFRLCGEKLGLKNVRVDSESLSGELRGLTLHVRIIPGGKNSPPHMAIEVTFAPCAILLELRLQTSQEERAVAAGEALDLTTGHATFDAAWIVEGAPAPRVLRLFENAPLRVQLIQLGHFPEAAVTIGEGKVTLYRRGSDLENGAVATERIELALALAEAVAAESDLPLPEGEPGEIDEAAADYRQAGRRGLGEGDGGMAQLLALKAMRGNRILRAARVPMFIGHALTPLVIALLLNDSTRGLGAAGAASLAFMQEIGRAHV